MKDFIFESFYSGMIKQPILHMRKNFCGVRMYSGGWRNSKKIQGLWKIGKIHLMFWTGWIECTFSNCMYFFKF